MNEDIRAISNFFNFLQKDFERKKKAQKVQKRKQANKNKKNIYGEESHLFAFLCFLFAQNLFVKK